MTSIGTSPLAAAQALAPRIAAVADRIEQERRLPPDFVAVLAEAGLFRLLVPRSLGGAEADPATFVRVVEEISSVDGSTGWCVMIGGFGGLFAGCLPSAAARDIFADPHAIAGGTFRPNGVAAAVDGGFRASGRWPLASGSPHATWLAGGCRIMDGDTPRLDATGAPEIRLFFFPAADCQLIDTWHVAGLRGTGSGDFAVTDLFVPAERTVAFREPPVEPGPLYALPLIGMAALAIAAVPLGIARHAIEALKELAGAKTPTWSRNLLRERGMVQAYLGQAEGLLRAGRALVYETLSDVWSTAQQSQPLSGEQVALMWLSATQATTLATQAVELMFSAGGASSVYASCPLERCLRDVHTAAQHICVTPTNYELAGQSFMGLDMRSSLWSIDDRTAGAALAPPGNAGTA